MGKLTLFAFAAALAFCACRDDYQAQWAAPVAHTEATTLPLGPERIRNSDKRGFADITCDGVWLINQALVTVEPVHGVWKITHLELLEEKRIDPTASASPQSSP